MQYKLPNGHWVESVVVVDGETGLMVTGGSSGSSGSVAVPLASTLNNSIVSVTSTITQLLTPNPNRSNIRFYNSGSVPVNIGSSLITWGTRCIVLDIGDLWVEDDAPNLGWFAICDSGTTSSISIQEVV